jgi:hypothetical protein
MSQMENCIPVCHDLLGGFKIVKCGQMDVHPTAFQPLLLTAGLRTTASQQSNFSTLMKNSVPGFVLSLVSGRASIALS